MCVCFYLLEQSPERVTPETQVQSRAAYLDRLLLFNGVRKEEESRYCQIGSARRTANAGTEAGTG
jgi:hypothetical protein